MEQQIDCSALLQLGWFGCQPTRNADDDENTFCWFTTHKAMEATIKNLPSHSGAGFRYDVSEGVFAQFKRQKSSWIRWQYRAIHLDDLPSQKMKAGKLPNFPPQRSCAQANKPEPRTFIYILWEPSSSDLLTLSRAQKWGGNVCVILEKKKTSRQQLNIKFHY